MIFIDIDSFTPPTEEAFFVKQRYLQDDLSDLRSEKPSSLIQKFESNFIPTTLPALQHVEIGELQESRSQLIEKRQQLLDSWGLFLRPSKGKQLEIIDEQLDRIEYQIIALQKNDRENEIASIEKFISNNEKLIQKYNSK